MLTRSLPFYEYDLTLWEQHHSVGPPIRSWAYELDIGHVQVELIGPRTQPLAKGSFYVLFFHVSSSGGSGTVAASPPILLAPAAFIAWIRPPLIIHSDDGDLII